MEFQMNIKAIILLNLNGKRALAKYYDASLDPRKTESQLFQKTRNQKKRNEIFVSDNSLVVYRFISDIHMYVVGSKNENPLILERTLNCLVEVTSTLLNRKPESKTLTENLTQVILAFDEICDTGILLETDPNLVLERVCLKESVAEQSLAQMFKVKMFAT